MWFGRQELNESVTRSQRVVEEVDGRLNAEYDSKLCEALQKMREEMEEQLRKSHDDTEAFYERKVCIAYLTAMLPVYGEGHLSIMY